MLEHDAYPPRLCIMQTSSVLSKHYLLVTRLVFAGRRMSKVEQEKTDKMLIKSLEREERERKRVSTLRPLWAMPLP